jgi:DNA-binding transcriptional MerR regulator
MRSYSIGEISKMFNLPISTLRYYDKEGLFPDLQRYGDRRLFTDYEIEALHVIECLKASGLGIKEIKHFMQWCEDGPSTYNLRMQLFEDRKKAVEEEIEQLQKTLALLKFKCWYYKTAMKDGSEDRVRDMMPDRLPPEIQELYDNGFTSDGTGPRRRP